MAISRSKKETLVAELNDVLDTAKTVAYAEYAGITVKDLQDLRRAARENNVQIKVLYAISAEDEVMPAKVLANFAKDHDEMKLAGAFDNNGQSMDAAAVTALSKLPTKNELIAQTVAQLLSPVNDVTNALSGNLHALLDGIADHATA